jgi:hypothetical protein
VPFGDWIEAYAIDDIDVEDVIRFDYEDKTHLPYTTRKIGSTIPLAVIAHMKNLNLKDEYALLKHEQWWNEICVHHHST